MKPVGCTYCAGFGLGFAVASSVLTKSTVTGSGLLAVRWRRIVAPAGTVVPRSVLASSEMWRGPPDPGGLFGLVSLP